MILSIASEAYDLFKGSTVELKREMVNRVFANLELSGGKLRYALREPFDRMFNLTDRHGWQAMIDAVRTDTRLRLLIVRNYPLWKVPQINPDYRGL